MKLPTSYENKGTDRPMRKKMQQGKIMPKTQKKRKSNSNTFKSMMISPARSM